MRLVTATSRSRTFRVHCAMFPPTIQKSSCRYRIDKAHRKRAPACHDELQRARPGRGVLGAGDGKLAPGRRRDPSRSLREGMFERHRVLWDGANLRRLLRGLLGPGESVLEPGSSCAWRATSRQMLRDLRHLEKSRCFPRTCLRTCITDVGKWSCSRRNWDRMLPTRIS